MTQNQRTGRWTAITLSAAIAAGALPLSAAGVLWPAQPAHAQSDPREPPHERVRRMRRADDPQKPYWIGFELKNEGDCVAAIDELEPLATRGRGYEEAQHALGICLMRLGGLPAGAGEPPARQTLTGNAEFREGLAWVSRSAQAGSFQAQRTMVALYAAELGPDTDPTEAAKWVHLYKVNPVRLALGVAPGEDEALRDFETSLPAGTLIAGKLRARRWTPTFWSPQADTARRTVANDEPN